MQKEFEKHGASLHQHISRVENELKVEIADIRDNQRHLTTGMDGMTKNFAEYWRDKNLRKLAFDELQQDVEESKKRDMEKATAIEKIQQEIDRSKVA